MAHFYYVHFAFPTYFKNIFEGHVATQFMESRGRPDIGQGSQYAGEDNLLQSEASYFGPSYMINWLWNDFRGTTVESILVNCHYPIDQNSFLLQYGVMTKKLPGLDREMANKIAGKFAKSFKVGFEQDVAIWKNKSRIDNPLLCEEDGPVYQLRRWYQQFYVDAADVTEDMTARFEFEIDTSHADRGVGAGGRREPAPAAPRRRQSRSESGLTVGQPTGPSTPTRACERDDRGRHAAVRRDRAGPGGLPELRRRGAGEEEQPQAHQRAVDRRGVAGCPEIAAGAPPTRTRSCSAARG